MVDTILPQAERISVRARFEIFKRDSFTCRYCGRTSPEVVLEVDHVVPLCEGGSSDAINLVTACWECNRGKGGIPLNEVMDAEDPHERALLLLDRERQLQEYNHVLSVVRERQEAEAQELANYWFACAHREVRRDETATLLNMLRDVPMERIRIAMRTAILNGRVSGLRYVFAIIRNWREEGVI